MLSDPNDVRTINGRGYMLFYQGDNLWTVTLSDAAKPILFKFLLNDITWCVGDDYITEPDTTTTIVPVF